jgi:hypothetical protein
MRGLSICLVLALAAAAPADARIAGKHPPGDVRPSNPFLGNGRVSGPGPAREARGIRKKIERAQDNGAISRREARQLKREARLITHLGRRYGRDGLSDSERRELEARSFYLRDALGRAQLGGSGSGVRR